MPRHQPRPDPEKTAQRRAGPYIMHGQLLLTEHEWNGGITPDDSTLTLRRREVGNAISHGEFTATPMPKATAPGSPVAQLIELRAAAPIRARCDQADMAETPLFGTKDLFS